MDDKRIAWQQGRLKRIQETVNDHGLQLFRVMNVTIATSLYSVATCAVVSLLTKWWAIGLVLATVLVLAPLWLETQRHYLIGEQKALLDRIDEADGAAKESDEHTAFVRYTLFCCIPYALVIAACLHWGR